MHENRMFELRRSRGEIGMRSQGMHIAKKAAPKRMQTPKRMQSYYEVLFFKSGTIRLIALSRVFGLRRARLGANAPSLVGIPTVVAHELEAFVGNVLADLTFSGASIEGFWCKFY